MERNIILKKTVGAIVLLIIALTSIFAISPVASSAKFHAKTIKSLDDKKVTVMKITAGAAGTATVLAAIPSDATTPLANQILKLSSYLLIVIGTIFLDFCYPFDNPNSKILIVYEYLRHLRPYSKIFLMCIGYLACINSILGIVALFDKNSNKKLTIISLIICSPFLIAFIIGNIQGLMIISGIWNTGSMQS